MINKVILLGNVGKDPESRQLESGKWVSTFSMATSKKYKNKQGEVQNNTEWHNVKCFGNLAEIVSKYLKKGSKIYIEGEIKTESWKDNDNKTKYMTFIIMNELKMIDSPNSQGSTPNQDQQQNNDVAESDELPF